MIKTVFFDFDGTLADTARDLVAATNLQRERAGLEPMPFEELRGYSSQGAGGLLKKALGLEKTDAAFEATRQQFLQDYYACMTDQTVLFPGITELLKQLENNGYTWGIVTNKAENLSFPIFDHLGLTQRSIANICGDTAARPKPYPDPLFLAAERAQVEPQDCIYIGDDARDIIAGKAAGMATIAVRYGYCDQPEEIASWQANITVDTPEQLWQAIDILTKESM
ncbi:MAG: HAD-IA family hydrolase [Pelistega sp.]|nr:HAD-IA family hydrolase [Pelistega sp.]